MNIKDHPRVFVQAVPMHKHFQSIPKIFIITQYRANTTHAKLKRICKTICLCVGCFNVKSTGEIYITPRPFGFLDCTWGPDTEKPFLQFRHRLAYLQILTCSHYSIPSNRRMYSCIIDLLLSSSPLLISSIIASSISARFSVMAV